MTKRSFRTGVLFIAVLTYASATWAQVQKVGLQTLGGSESNVYAVNDMGLSVGWATDTEGLIRAVRWDKYGNVLDLATFPPTTITVVGSSAIGINNLGQIIGNYTDSAKRQRAFIWTEEGGMRDLGTLGGQETSVIAINEAGQVIGRSESTTPDEWRPFIITPHTNDNGMLEWYQGNPPMNELMTDLGPTPNGRPWGGKYSPFGPTALNNQGIVVGIYEQPWGNTGMVYRGFGWSQATGAVDLGTLGGAEGDSTEPLALSDFYVAGYSTKDGKLHAFLIAPQLCEGIMALFCPTIEPGFIMADLGTLGGPYSIARAVNNAGRVAGMSNYSPAGPSHAVIWAGAGPQDLGTLGGNAQPAWSEASAMNETGQIIGRSRPPSCPESDADYCHHGFVWSETTGMIDLPPLTRDYTRSWAVAISNTGYVVGYSGYWIYPHWYTRSVVWIADSTPPAINIASPEPSYYLHSDILVINFSASDPSALAGPPTATLDASAVNNGQEINLLSLSLGMHTLSVVAVDNIGNSGSESVSFDIIATLDSLTTAVTYFAQKGEINDNNLWKSLLRKLSEAQEAMKRENMRVAVNKLKDFIDQVIAQSGRHITTNAASLLVIDAEYVISCL